MNDSFGPSGDQPWQQPGGQPQQPQQPGQQPGQPQQPPHQGGQQPGQGQWNQPPAQHPGQPQQPPYQGGQQPGQPQGQQWGGPQGQQPGQQQWGAPQYGAQPPQGGGGVNKKIVIGGLVVLLLIIGGIIAAVLLTGGDDDDKEASSDSPVATVEAFIKASEDDDCEAAKKLIRDGDDLPCEDFDSSDEDISFGDVTEKSVDGDKAEVDVEYTQGGETDTETLSLSKVDGKWLIDFGGGDGSSDEGSSSQSAPESPDSAEVQPETVTPDGGGDTTAVTSVATTFVSAIESNQCDIAKAWLVDPDSADCSEITTDDAEGVTFGEPNVISIDSETATVGVDMTAGGSSVGTFTIEMVHTDSGEWKIESWHY
ncbi:MULTISPECIES: Rv0361 family membrane protein [unclassified Nocardioides]|uniref:Rv0361 family membrane protein n=1 Tax=unclassified Nocardioides TaxID=2615069 RepID=UPI0006F67BBA|nr:MULTISPECIES: hypothetical protein [unclassified Nocardioides]KQY56288.1 hypothetical protein ASD30_07990 [Nocardioides sp. Root140]KRF14147.1 hypothetical protein ASH02_07230 [Nocardioides sp. Soil796]